MSVIEKMSSIPDGIQTNHLREVQSDVEPMIRLDGKTLFIPIFVRQEEATDEQGNVHTSYRYFEAPAAYVGQDMADYSNCCLQSYADIRAYLYGDWKTQNEQILKSTFTAHQYAVREAFPKYDGEIPQNIVRFEEIHLEFWQTIDACLTQLEKTRDDLPAQPFSSEQMLAWAMENGMTQEQIASYVPIFQNISLNLLHNGRNWSELFPAPVIE